MTRIGTEGYDEFVQEQLERKVEKPKRITLKSGKRIRVYCGCTNSGEHPWREASKKGQLTVLNKRCFKCKFFPWTFTKLNENEV